MLYGGTLGANYRIAPGLSLTLQGRYMVGEFDKVMVFNAGQAEIVEVVDMTGPQISVGVKFRL